MKSYSVYALYPDLPSAHAEHTARVTATSVSTAAARALRDIGSRHGVKGKRVTRVKLTIQICCSKCEPEAM